MERLRRFFGRLCALLIAASFPGIAAAQTDGAPWIGTWTTAPTPMPIDKIGFNPLTLSRQTIRQYVFTSVGGDEGRLHFSNEYGNAPLVISDVYVGYLADNNGNVVPGSNHPVTFKGGRTTITIAPGEAIVSDPIAIAIPANGWVVVSTYLPGNRPSTVTGHTFLHARQSRVRLADTRP